MHKMCEVGNVHTVEKNSAASHRATRKILSSGEHRAYFSSTPRPQNSKDHTTGRSSKGFSRPRQCIGMCCSIPLCFEPSLALRRCGPESEFALRYAYNKSNIALGPDHATTPRTLVALSICRQLKIFDNLRSSPGIF